MELMELRKKLYEILTADQEHDDRQINATQQMGVSLSNTIKKDGVMIIQMQNVVSKTVIKHVTEALKLLDAMELEQRIIDVTPVGEETPQIEDSGEPTIRDFLNEAVEAGIPLDLLCRKVGGMYLLAVLDKYEEDEARRRLKIREPRFTALKREAERDET
jgi:hypothetical protein